jgi:hypothetical protein
MPMENLIRQAALLAENGVKELFSLPRRQHLYGEDLYGQKKLLFCWMSYVK